MSLLMPCGSSYTIFQLLMLFGLIVGGCANPSHNVGVRCKAPATRTAPTPIGVPLKPICRPEAIMRVSIPHDIYNLRLSKGLNASEGKVLTIDSVKKLLAAAHLLNPTEASLKEWSYAPWYFGTFIGPDGEYHYELFLGGRGRLTTPNGEVGFFSFVP